MRGRSPCSGSGGSGPCRPSPGGSSRTVAGSRPRTRRPRPGSPAAGRAVGCRQGTPELGPGSAGAGCRASRSSSDDPGPSPLQAHLTLESILPSGSLLIGQGGGLTVAVDRARGWHAPSGSEGLAKWWGVLFKWPWGPSSAHATANTPAETVGARVARFSTAGSLPRFHGGSASALGVSRPAQRFMCSFPLCAVGTHAPYGIWTG